MKIYAIILCLCFVSLNALAADIAKSRNGVAIEGYDPVAYFSDRKARKGEVKISYQWGGALWHFVSVENLTLFKQDPEKYMPRYGGYCANGLSDGHKIEANPNNWRIIDGKLYLFFSQYGREQWSGKIKPLMESAEQSWDELKTD